MKNTKYIIMLVISILVSLGLAWSTKYSESITELSVNFLLFFILLVLIWNIFEKVKNKKILIAILIITLVATYVTSNIRIVSPPGLTASTGFGFPMAFKSIWMNDVGEGGSSYNYFALVINYFFYFLCLGYLYLFFTWIKKKIKRS